MREILISQASGHTVPRSPVVLAAVLAAAALLFFGCSSGKRSKNADVVVSNQSGVEKLANVQNGLELTAEKAANNPRIQVSSGAAVEKAPEYRMGPGDVVEVVYHIQYDKVDAPYKLQVQDRINVVFAFHPQFNSSAIVRSDGKISLPMLGDVAVEGQTPADVAANLKKLYSRYIISPTLSVSLEESNVKIDELKKAITTAPRGQSKIAPVSPDGKLGFPIVGTVQAAGLTVAQLEKELNDRYKASVQNLHVNVILNEIHYSRCFVAGEVERPGAYEIPMREPLLAVLARAGSFKKTGDLSEVVIFRYDGLERAIAIKVDLSQATDNALAATNILVHPADIIYVPKGAIDNLNDWIEKIFTKGIYAVIPASAQFSGGYDFSKYVLEGAQNVQTPVLTPVPGPVATEAPAAAPAEAAAAP
jgi:polysaccharide export outer membrane protein